MKERLDNVVQWYPGHMVRAMRRIAEYLKLIDIVVEVIDARAVRSDANPMLDKLIAGRPRIVALSRDDLADPATTKSWIEDFAAHDREAIAVEARAQQSVSRILAAVTAKAKERSGISRLMVVGVPNSGKSSLINGLLRRGAAKTEDRAGVTRTLQWFRLARKHRAHGHAGHPRAEDRKRAGAVEACTDRRRTARALRSLRSERRVSPLACG